jgi:hypothetical protein
MRTFALLAITGTKEAEKVHWPWNRPSVSESTRTHRPRAVGLVDVA